MIPFSIEGNIHLSGLDPDYAPLLGRMIGDAFAGKRFAHIDAHGSTVHFSRQVPNPINRWQPFACISYGIVELIQSEQGVDLRYYVSLDRGFVLWVVQFFVVGILIHFAGGSIESIGAVGGFMALYFLWLEKMILKHEIRRLLSECATVVSTSGGRNTG
jgi:hypothetical protein